MGGVNAVHSSVTPKVPLIFEKSIESGYLFSPRVEYGASGYVEKEILSFDVDLPGEPSEYSEVTASFYLDGRADDGFYFFVNDEAVYKDSNNAAAMGYCWSGCGSVGVWARRQITKELKLTEKNNTVKIKAVSWQGGWFVEVWSAKITVRAVSK